MLSSQGETQGGSLLALAHYETGLPMVCSTADLGCHIWDGTAWADGPTIPAGVIPDASKAGASAVQLRDGRVFIAW